MLNYSTCAHALPEAPPLPGTGGKTLYRVTEFCRSAGRCVDIPVLQNGLIVCQTCPMYTDRRKFIHIRNSDFRAELFLDRLADLPIQNLRKIFKLMFSERTENEEAIFTTDNYLRDVQADGAKAKKWMRIQTLWNDTKHKMNIM